MKILFVNPYPPSTLPVPGIGYLWSYLKAYGPEVELSFADRQSIGSLKGKPFDVVAVSVDTYAVPYVVGLKKSFDPEGKSHWVAGGHHASALPDQMFEMGFDQVVRGPGEKALVGIVNGCRDKVVQGTMERIDWIPFPDYRSQTVTKGRWDTMILSSRGCPHQCTYCSSSAFWGRKVYLRQATSVLGELEMAIKDGVNTFIFEDDNFTMKKSRVKEICEGLKGYGRKHWWECSGRAEALDDEMCEMLASAGCTMVWMGVESGSDKILQRCKKGTTAEQQEKGIHAVKRSGMKAHVHIIVGLSGESAETVAETKSFLQRTKPDEVAVKLPWVLPGTELYRTAKSLGFDDSAFLKGVPLFVFEQEESTLRSWASTLPGIKCY